LVDEKLAPPMEKLVPSSTKPPAGAMPSKVMVVRPELAASNALTEVKIVSAWRRGSMLRGLLLLRRRESWSLNA